MEIYDRFINIIYKENYYRKDGTSNFKGVINQDIPKFSGAHNRIPAWKYIYCPELDEFWELLPLKKSKINLRVDTPTSKIPLLKA